jgi:hypothetical protein
MTLDEMLDVITAAKNGEPLQSCMKGTSRWSDVDVNCWPFNFQINDYRRKPKLLECWVNVYADDNLGGVHTTKEAAGRYASSGIVRRAHLVEVPDDRGAT